MESTDRTSPGVCPPVNFTPAPTKAIAFVTIPAVDVQRAQKFYETVFGWNFWTAPGQSVTVFFTSGEVMGRLSKEAKVAVESDGAASVRLYTNVEDVKKTLESVKAAGGDVVMDPFIEGGHTELAVYRDTEGNTGGILHWLI